LIVREKISTTFLKVLGFTVVYIIYSLMVMVGHHDFSFNYR
jgi:hypothetical protein